MTYSYFVWLLSFLSASMNVGTLITVLSSAPEDDTKKHTFNVYCMDGIRRWKENHTEAPVGP